MGEYYDHSREQNLEMLSGSCHGGGSSSTSGHGHGSGGSGGGGAFVQWTVSEDYVFFQWWTANTSNTFWITVFLLFFIAVFYEILAYFRGFLEATIMDKLTVRRQSGRSVNSTGQATSHLQVEEAQILRTSQKPRLSERPPIFFEGRLPWKAPSVLTHFVVFLNLALLYGFQVFIAYFLMMVFMSFNGYFILAILSGFTCGKFATLPLRKKQQEDNEYSSAAQAVSTYETPCH